MLSSGTSETARPKYVRQSSKWLDLANRQNPTLAIHVTSAWTIEWTYAELLQYASIILAARGIAFLQWTSSIVYLNFTVIFLVLVSLGARRKAEQLGLRRTALVLCTVLFFITICLTTFLPVYRDEKAIRTDSPHITSNTPESLPSTFSAVQTCAHNDAFNTQSCKSPTTLLNDADTSEDFKQLITSLTSMFSDNTHHDKTSDLCSLIQNLHTTSFPTHEYDGHVSLRMETSHRNSVYIQCNLS